MCAFCAQEGHLAAPLSPSEAARCASKETSLRRIIPLFRPESDNERRRLRVVPATATYDRRFSNLGVRSEWALPRRARLPNVRPHPSFRVSASSSHNSSDRPPRADHRQVCRMPQPRWQKIQLSCPPVLGWPWLPPFPPAPV